MIPPQYIIIYYVSDNVNEMILELNPSYKCLSFAQSVYKRKTNLSVKFSIVLYKLIIFTGM